MQSANAVQAVMLDEVMKAGSQPVKEQLLQFEMRSLRDTRQLLSSVSTADAMQFIEQNQHPRHRASLCLAICCLPVIASACCIHPVLCIKASTYAARSGASACGELKLTTQQGRLVSSEALSDW